MNYLTVENLSKNFGEKVLYENLTFHINEGEKIALIAKNGTGKTSLLKVIAGIENAELGGKVSIHKDIHFAYLEQQPSFDTNETVLECMLQGSDPRLNAVFEYEEIVNKAEVDIDLLQHAIEKMDKLQAWDIEAHAKKVLSILKLENLEQRVNTLSGGQQKRLALSKILISEPQFLILDEPTNHLDIEMIEWLEEYLQGRNITLLMVTHDRYFMENICNEIWELEGGIINKYRGSYATYLEKRAERKSIEAASIDKAKNLYSKELDWMRRSPSARGTKAKARIDSFYKIEEVAKTRLDEKEMALEINMPRLGGKIAEFHHVNKSYNEVNLMKDFSYKFKPGEKVGIVGNNGVGKSTLLNMLTGRDQPDTGKIVIGETVKIGYYDQQNLQLAQDKKAIDIVREIADYIPLNGGRMLSASQLLERFLFEPSSQYTFVSKLSGGEQRRLYLLKVLMGNPNFIILDEPTNDLDIVTLQVLEDFLIDYRGCVVIVSHDRFFMDKMVDHIFAFEGDGIVKDFPGSYSQYRDFKIKETKDRYQNSSQPIVSEKKIEDAPIIDQNTKKKKLSFNEKREYDSIEKDIFELETRKEELSLLMSKNPSFDELNKYSAELIQIQKDIEFKTERWFYLGAIES
ncbi:MAG: ABC-F family ATP-binding cassette domain-containing protein [Bacteroidota bacterium]